MSRDLDLLRTALATASLGSAFGFVGSMPLVGPVAVMVVSRGVQRRYRAAFWTGAGAAVSEGLYAGVAYWAFSTFLTQLRFLRPWFDAAASLLLLFIGLRFARWVDRPSTRGPDRDDTRSFLAGLSVTALNPTILLTWTGAITTLYSTGWVDFAPSMALWLAVGAALGITAWFGVLVAAVKRYEDQLPRRTIRALVRGIGWLLVVAAGYLAVVAVKRFRHPAVSLSLRVGATPGLARTHGLRRHELPAPVPVQIEPQIVVARERGVVPDADVRDRGARERTIEALHLLGVE